MGMIHPVHCVSDIMEIACNFGKLNFRSGNPRVLSISPASFATNPTCLKECSVYPMLQAACPPLQKRPDFFIVFQIFQ